LAEVVACLEHDDDVVRALFPVLEHEPQRYLGEDREVTFALERGMNTQQHTVQHTAQHTVQHTVQHTRRAGFSFLFLSSSLLFSSLLFSSLLFSAYFGATHDTALLDDEGTNLHARVDGQLMPRGEHGCDGVQPLP
jgi:hypothetical protein